MYLERTNNSLDSLSYVTINSTFNLVTWDDLQPNIVSKVIPTIKEISNEYASIELKYIISLDSENGLDYYYVDEFYRIKYTPNRMYLLDYERTMESLFDGNNQILKPGDIKLGVTNNEDIEIFINEDSTRFAFVFNREIWTLNQFENSATKVFSFRQNESDYIRDVYDDHYVKIINMDEDGNVDFLVYGYMNRGAYEGHVGLVLYRYYSLDNRISELTYIPINLPYQFMKEIVGGFTYINKLDIFYFHLNDTIYKYNLLTKQLEEVVTNIDVHNFVFSRRDHYIAWEEMDKDGLSKKIIMYDLETQNKNEIISKDGTVINLLGTIGTDFIYGIANIEDIIATLEGKNIIPMFKIIISNSSGKKLKEYQEEGYYTTDIEVDNNIITLKRGTISSDGGRAHIIPARGDNILNNVDFRSSDIQIISQDSELPAKEWHIIYNSSGEEPYKYKETVNTVITRDTTRRMDKDIEYPGEYIVYALGDVQGIYEDAGYAIKIADELSGSVLNLDQHIIWQRGFTSDVNEIQDSSLTEQVASGDSFKSSAKTLVKYKFHSLDNRNDMSGFDLLQEYFGDSYVNLTGTSLEQALYFVSEDRPVIAKAETNYYVIIRYIIFI